MISIVLPNFNGQKLLEENLPKVLEAGRKWRGNFEVIVVDDASWDESIPFLKKNYPQVKLIVHKKNQRFAVSCNDGVAVAKGEIIVLLNTDVVPHKNFLKPLVSNFKDDKVFAVGCKEKSIQEGEIVYSGRALGEFKRGFLIHWRASNQSKKSTLWTASGNAAYRKKIWTLLGGFDPIFRPAYGEDLDLSYRALKAGYKVMFEPESIVFHQHETTNREAFGLAGIKIAAFKNQILFVWKNITDFSLLLKHFLWLPYHLLVGTITSRGLFLIGFLKALRQVGEVLKSRKKVKKLFKFSDKEILSRYA